MKRIFSCLIAVILLLSFSFAYTVEESADVLVRLNLMKGYEDGSLRLENSITRAEFCSLIVRMMKKEGTTPDTEIRFSDMKETHWAFGTVLTAVSCGYLSGYADGTFKPSNSITYAETCAILVNVLGYNADITGKWPTNVMQKAEELKLNDGLQIEESSYKMTRGEVCVMLVNALGAVPKK
ncbi:MAG: S-layer homology domain-containing protein [Clostridia bacterium]|nr:S-layer homology domain-containing protein [Clostridia bacterium]